MAKIRVGRGAVDIVADERSGAVWVASVYLPKDYEGVGYDIPEYSKARNLTRVDPATNRVVAEIPIRAGSPEGGVDHVAVGEGAVWAHGGGGLFKVDPASNEVAATLSLGKYSSYLAVYGGAVWAMDQVSIPQKHQTRGGQDTRLILRLVRVDPRTMHVVVAEDLGPVSGVGTGWLVAGGGYVWFPSGDELARVAP